MSLEKGPQPNADTDSGPGEPSCSEGEAPALGERMQRSRALVTGSYLALGGVAYGVGAVKGHAFEVLPAVAMMPVLSLVSLRAMRRRPRLQTTLTVLNLALDTLLTSWIVYWTGGAESPCLPFYLTTLMAASFRFGACGSLWAALLALACAGTVGAVDPRPLSPLRGVAEMGVRVAFLFAAAGFGLQALHRRMDRYRRERSLNRRLARANHDLAAAYRDLQAAQERLLHAEKLASLGRLVAGVAHEINNPISFVYGNLVHLEAYVRALKSLLAFDDGLPLVEADRRAREERKAALDDAFVREDVDRALRACRHGAERVRKIVEALLNLSRTRKAPFREVVIREPLEGALSMLEGKIRQGIRVIRRYGDGLVVRGDPDELGQLFLNLLSNALDAVAGGGTVWIRTGRGPLGEGKETVLVEIQDDGPGIPPADRSHLFEPFFTTKPVGRGTGLGLSIAYGIARRHGGTIVPHFPGKGGSLFRVSLPGA